MQIAARLLAKGDASLASVAAEVGYDSEFAFSRAFKRHTGQAPGVWRRRVRAEAPTGATGATGATWRTPLARAAA
jgi:AraC-like DNA-binding protein